MGASDPATSSKIEGFIQDWGQRKGGSERADAQTFLNELCRLLEVDPPHAAQAKGTSDRDYGFERPVQFRHDDGTTSPGRIDLYKKGCFVLEAKQSTKRQQGGETFEQLPLELRGGVGVLERSRAKSNAKPASTWDALMRGAKRQAEDYARSLDEWPPFIIVVDVGRVVELYADFSRQGKNYAQFPNRNTFRISMGDLLSEEVRARLKAVWEAPFSLDPAARAAEVTQEIAALLAKMTQSLERRAKLDDSVQKAEHAYKVSKFLMRCIFGMFAEDIGLLPEGGFLKLIELHQGRANRFHLAANDFFEKMDKGGYNAAIQADIRRFNGGLFRENISVEITEDELTLLDKAARRDWRNVEPAIFGTLLEQALSERERSKLGAHYTPRAYVERLVVPTIIEPLREDWDAVQSDAIGKLLESNEAGAREVVKRFHDKLCHTIVLDPACGTGNFLYVSLELMKRLEGEVLDSLKQLGEPNEPLQTVHPRQFRGIEKNPRAVPIAELVLWIGYIQWWFRIKQSTVFADPVLDEMNEIEVGDAVLAYDHEELLRDDKGRPITRQDPTATKLHPITGEPVPDSDAKLPVYRYVNSRPAQWPAADFIVGNPPFIGGKDLRAELGDGYTQALWASRGKKSDSIDFVMYWWDQAATVLRAKGSRLRRFGFITTNSITQKFSRRVLERHLKAPKDPASLLFAVPDHPWVKTGKGMGKKAAVRIAMTVVARGERVGKLAEVVEENALDTDQPKVVLAVREGRIGPDLALGADATSAISLKANEGLAHMGMKLHGDGFIVTPAEAGALGFGKSAAATKLIRPFANGRDLAQRPRGVMVIDAYPLTESELRTTSPAVYQRLLDRVKPERDLNREPFRKKFWWWFGRTHEDQRQALSGLDRYIVTTRTAKFRIFSFAPKKLIAESKVVLVSESDAYLLGVLSSRQHEVFSLRVGGWLGVGNDPTYNHTDCFDPFPFPAATETQKATVRALAEELDALRKKVIAEHDFLTMTKLYNVRERLAAIEAWELAASPYSSCPALGRASTSPRAEGVDGRAKPGHDDAKRPPPLTEAEKAIHDAGCVGVIHELHKRIDAAVAEAYGWPADLSDEEILTRLVALNRERAEEERSGFVRWLRPDYQIPRFGEARAARKEQQIEAALEAPEAVAPTLPKDDAELVATLRRTLRSIGKPAEAPEIATRFREGRRAAKRVERGLQLLAAAGVARRATNGWFVAGAP